MADVEMDPPSSRDIAGEDFLFHLYRGSELLQENRVHEAKQELEQALGLQPRDPKGQDLLAIVYFRLGLYPRAIRIYEELIGAYPDATTPRINLALCYLKTGQPSAARTVLEHVIVRDPSHTRAWGYLGLAFQRLGDLERAMHAFQAGGHHQMARRVEAIGRQGAMPAAGSVAVGAGPGELSLGERAVVSRAMSAAFDEIDRRDFRTDASAERLATSGTWAAVEPGRDGPTERRSVWPGIPSMVEPSQSIPPVASLGSVAPAPAPAIVSMQPHVPSAPPPATFPPPAWRAPLGAESFARDALCVFPRDHEAAVHASGLVLLRAARGPAVRLDAVRGISLRGPLTSRPVHRRARGIETDEPLGGAAAPLVHLEGAFELVLGAPSGTKLIALALDDEGITVRESAVVALAGDLALESGKMPGGEGDGVPIVQLRGTGPVVLALPPTHAALELAEGRELVLRAHGILGWVGRVTPRAMAQSDAPARVRGLVSLRGEGLVLVDAR
jgi:hypothetical protein